MCIYSIEKFINISQCSRRLYLNGLTCSLVHLQYITKYK